MAKFLITIDTEGDNLWGGPAEITTRNAKFLPRFQTLCEQYGFLPTYLTNYEMAIDPGFVTFGKDLIRRGTGEIGMHLHAWHSPPSFPLTDQDTRYMPYLIEYPPDIIWAKVAFLTDLLEQTFGLKMQSHRAGRWAFNSVYANVLAEFGYVVDCSVTPGIDWRGTKGRPDGSGGTDYRHFPRRAYYMDADDISSPAMEGLMQVPMTILTSTQPPALVQRTLAFPMMGFARRRFWPTEWLRPNGRNLAGMRRIIDASVLDQADYIEFMLHSSELMPGGSPTFATEESIEGLYRDIEAMFMYIAPHFSGETLTGFCRDIVFSGAATRRMSDATADLNKFSGAGTLSSLER
jgi:hypothetical protein